MSKQRGKILMIDDEADLLKISSSILRREGFSVVTRTDSSQALSLLQQEQFDVILLDLLMPGMDGLAFLEQFDVRQRPEEVIILTAYSDVQSAVETVKRGAYGYLAKPFDSAEVINRIDNIRELQILRAENERLRQEQDAIGGLIGDDKAMQAVYDLIRKVAPTPLSVLIRGESGTGKELVAQAVHQTSNRANHPFVCCNCAALAPGVLESELFGHVKGSFTGAVRNRKGRFLEADGGTLFLDEIGDMNIELQTRLLRVLQEGEFEPVGSTQTCKVDVRVISATHKDLEQAIADGDFRGDLFYRINTVTIDVPPLRQRKGDIALLCQFLIDQMGERLNKQVRRVGAQALACLESYDWPGNVRELENAILRAMALAQGEEITAADLPANIRDCTEEEKPEEEVLFHAARQRFEEQFIRDALEKTGGNISQAAQQIQLGRRNLQRKIKQFDIDVSQYSRRP